ncbi:unnamed protein product [Meganyctiphanes norvegica]|uniref:AFP-like domain-containing protein n=1 Tax=Meganyctiphanes norvegica TaxID=48144 RepID=A0AAV2Q7E9_MEGNR
MEPLELVPGRYIGEGQPCFIIAEIGQNHQGNIDLAKQLIEKAKECGADCVKLQKSCLSSKFNNGALEQSYDSEHSWADTYGKHKEHLEFTKEQFKELQNYGKEIGMPVTASGMDIPSMEMLIELDAPFLKIGSGDINNLPLVRRAARSRKPLVVSTGMTDIAWVTKVYNEVMTANIPPPGHSATPTQLVLMQCTSAYPTPPEHVHLRVLDTYAQVFPHAHIGYSGHEMGITITLAAVARGARVIERHITLNNTWKGNDHKCSLEPHDFRELVRGIRIVEEALGSPLKAFQPSEEPCYNKLGKTVVATRTLPAGTVIKPEDIVAKVAVPKGLTATLLDSLVGKSLKTEVLQDHSIMEDDVL